MPSTENDSFESSTHFTVIIHGETLTLQSVTPNMIVSTRSCYSLCIQAIVENVTASVETLPSILQKVRKGNLRARPTGKCEIPPSGIESHIGYLVVRRRKEARKRYD